MTNVRRRFRELIARPGLVVMPGAYDALSAKLIAAGGYEAVSAGGYAAIGSMLGEVDGGQSNVRDYADHYARIAGAVDLPVVADADTGFGGTGNVRQMVRAFEAAGVAAIMFSDQVFPNRCGYLPGKQVVARETMVARILAAVDARRDPETVIIARTDVMALEGLDAALERCHLYLEAGADLAKPQGVDTALDLARVVREVPCPHIATQSHAAGLKHLPWDELERLGVAGVTLPSACLFAAAEGVRRMLEAAGRDRSLANTDGEAMRLEDYYRLVGLDEQNAREKLFDQTAASLVDGNKTRGAAR
jgi:methylisocitrate lyase